MTQPSQTMELNRATHNYPIPYLSYSSFSKFHRNPGGWKEQYILHNRYFKSSPAMIVGKMAHKVVENYMSGIDINIAIENSITYFNNEVQDNEVKWGKTGSRENILKDFTSAVKMYFEEMPKYENVILSEKQITSIVTDEIQWRKLQSPIPFLGIPDLVFRENEKIIIEDFKFKTKHTDISDGIEPMYWFQSLFYYYLVKNELKEEPSEMRFREVKISKNKDNSSQHNIITINFKSEDFDFMKAHFWYQILGFFKFIENTDADSYFPYNIYDQMDGKETFNAMQSTVFGYKMDSAQKSDLVKMEKEEFKNTKFIQSNTPTTIEGKIKYKFQEFGIALEFAKMQEWYAYDRYLFEPSRGVKMSEVKKYAEDVEQATEVENIRIVAPVPWTKYVGVEIPKENRKFSKIEEKDVMPIGRDINKKLYTLDFTNPDTPHVLIAGKSGSGKSQLIKALIESRPKDYQLVCIDPKLVELTKYKNESLLYASFPEDALMTLENIEYEMKMRYRKMEREWVSEIGNLAPRMMVVIDEYASLKLHPKLGKEIEKILINLTNMGRACGIHIIIATQRPSVDVITGLIKANIGCRICLSVASQIDSKVVIEQPWAEKLAGKGDLLYVYPWQEPIRLQALSLN